MFLRRVARTLAVVLALPSMSIPAQADSSGELFDVLGIEKIVEVMRDEGRDYSASIARDMLPAGETPGWARAVEQLYDAQAMEEIVRAGFDESFGDTDPEPLIAFFSSEEGQQIVAREIEARREMIDPTVDAAAREDWRELAGDADPRLDQLDRFVEANGLVETNVVGALNASFQFYLGLVDGGGLEMTEPEIVDEVWLQEEVTRADTREWLYAYLLIAYEPLSTEALDRYIDISESPEGLAMNRALFAGFNHMYEEISYGLGLAAARDMLAQDL